MVPRNSVPTYIPETKTRLRIHEPKSQIPGAPGAPTGASEEAERPQYNRISDPFYDRGITFPLFCFWKKGFFDPNVNLDFEKEKRFIGLGHGIIRRDAFWFLLKSAFGWGMELLKWGEEPQKVWGETSIVERLID